MKQFVDRQQEMEWQRTCRTVWTPASGKDYADIRVYSG